MRTSTNWILASVSLLTLLGIGAAAAGGMNQHPARDGRHPGPAAVFRVCTDDSMRVGECKELVKQKMQEPIGQMYPKCLERKDQAFCDGKKAEAEKRKDNFSEPKDGA